MEAIRAVLGRVDEDELVRRNREAREGEERRRRTDGVDELRMCCRCCTVVVITWASRGAT